MDVLPVHLTSILDAQQVESREKNDEGPVGAFVFSQMQRRLSAS